jgi:hypothetical protein
MPSSSVNDLIRMRDVESLNDILEDSDDWILQLDAAEGLMQLGDRRGLEFLMIARETDYDDMRIAADEVLESEAGKRMRAEIEAETRRAHEQRMQAARQRLQKGKKVFIYKMIFIPSGELMQDDPLGEGFTIPSLDEIGLEGWEVVNMIPRRRQLLVGNVDDHFTGAYFLLKKHLASAEEAAEIED